MALIRPITKKASIILVDTKSTNGSLTSLTFDCTGLNNYQSLSASDFLVVPESYYVSVGGSTQSGTPGAITPSISYDSSTGQLTVSNTITTQNDVRHGYYTVKLYYLNQVTIS